MLRLGLYLNPDCFLQGLRFVDIWLDLKDKCYKNLSKILSPTPPYYLKRGAITIPAKKTKTGQKMDYN